MSGVGLGDRANAGKVLFALNPQFASKQMAGSDKRSAPRCELRMLETGDSNLKGPYRFMHTPMDQVR